MNFKKGMLTLAVFATAFSALGQEAVETEKGGKTVIKYNLTGALLKHHLVQIERATARKQSFNIAVGMTRKSGIPMRDLLVSQYGGDQQAEDILNSTTYDKLTVTPEYRFYVGRKAAPRGFYIAPFMRYSKLESAQTYSWTDQDNNRHTTDFKGTLTGIGGGILFGSQFALGKHVVLDLWLLGPMYGKQTGTFDGIDSRKITDPVGAKRDIEAIDLGPWKLVANVTNQTISGAEKGVVKVDLSGPFLGIRTGLSLGVRF